MLQEPLQQQPPTSPWWKMNIWHTQTSSISIFYLPPPSLSDPTPSRYFLHSRPLSASYLPYLHFLLPTSTSFSLYFEIGNSTSKAKGWMKTMTKLIKQKKATWQQNPPVRPTPTPLPPPTATASINPTVCCHLFSKMAKTTTTKIREERRKHNG